MNDTRETFVEEIVDNVTDYGSYDKHDTNTDQTYLTPNENTSNLRPYGFELFIVEGICLNSVGKYICGQKILKPLFIGTNSQRNWIKRALNPYWIICKSTVLPHLNFGILSFLTNWLQSLRSQNEFKDVTCQRMAWTIIDLSENQET